MASADDLLDRRRLRRKLSFWRIVAIVVTAAAVLWAATLALPSGSLSGGALPGGDSVARIFVEGPILEDRDRLELIERLTKDESVRAIVVRINSPGGTTVGGEALYDALRHAASVKPVVAEVGTLAASAGYMVAAASEHIVARRTSIVGSVGVIFQYADATELLDTVGVEIKAIKSSPMKAEPSPFEPTSEEARDMIRRLVLDTYVWFRELVAERRSLDAQAIDAVSDGSVFSGRQALDLRLVDSLGGEEAVRLYLQEAHDISPNVPIVDRRTEDEGVFASLFTRSWQAALEAAGLGTVGRALGHLAVPGVPLDGLMSLWQPPGR